MQKYLGGLLLLSAIFILCVAFGMTDNEGFDTARREILLRRIGHEILLQSGDSTSRVLPVNKIAKNEYQVSFENAFSFQPDSLVNTTQRLLAKDPLGNDYVVNVLNCANASVAYGYAISKNKKEAIYALILSLVVVSGLVFANRELKIEASKKELPTPVRAAIGETALEQWEATPDGIKFKKWEASAAGKKVYAAEAKIRKHIKDSSNMEAVVTSLSLPPGSRLGFGVMVRIYGDDYILSFGPKKPNEFQQLHSLKVADKIILRSRTVSHAPKYSYPIVSGDYVERDRKIIYKSVPRKGGC